eukprot:905384-Prymnesium_polylepis.1
MTSLGNHARCKILVCEELGSTSAPVQNIHMANDLHLYSGNDISTGTLRFSLGLSADGTFQIVNEVTNTVVVSASDSTSSSNIPTLPPSSELSPTNPNPTDRTEGWFLNYNSTSNTYIWEQLNLGELGWDVIFQQTPTAATDTDLGNKATPYNETHTNCYKLGKISMEQIVPL